MQEFSLHSPTELSAVADWLLAHLGESRILLLEGEIGAGKTTFSKEFCKKLGITAAVDSPTFSIVNEYEYLDATGQQQLLYHLDLYRLESLEEALDIGIEEYLDSGSICLIEWPELVEALLPASYWRIRFEIIEDSSRKILLLNAE